MEETLLPSAHAKPVERGAATTSTRAEEGVVVVAATAGLEISRRMASDRPSEAAFLASLRCSLLRARPDDRLVHIHVGDGRDADARRLDDVDGVDADARTDVARRRGVVPRHVGRDDGGDDAAVPGAHAAALPPGRRQDRRDGAWAR